MYLLVRLALSDKVYPRRGRDGPGRSPEMVKVAVGRVHDSMCVLFDYVPCSYLDS